MGVAGDGLSAVTRAQPEVTMNFDFTPQQKSARAEFRAFVGTEIVPHADRFDREQRIPAELIEQLGARGYLGLTLPQEWGGGAADMLTYGLLNEEVGRGCSSVRSLLTVHGMVAHAILRWGTRAQKERWLPKIAAGENLGAFALTEHLVGRD